MPARLEIFRWIQVYRPVSSIAQSGDGQYVAVGSEVGAAVFNLSGHRLGAYPAADAEMPVHQIRTSLDFTRLSLATRLGDLLVCDLEPSAGRFSLDPRHLHHSVNGIHTLDFAAERIVLGHYTFALTMLDLEGNVVWRQQDSGEAVHGCNWSVSLTADGNILYVGSASSGTNWLLALDAGSGMALHRRECDGAVMAVAALADNAGVAVLTPDEYDAVRLIAYSADLGKVLWKQNLDSPATLAADAAAPLLAVGGGYEGRVAIVDAASGAVLASTALRVTVNNLSLVCGRCVAAATQDNSVALLRYLP
ncbi:MAG TPA: PQQ-binding-like beta-propeller repeat protein [Anaerolineae bacterium]|nr:PQQ-binding-like beta-propeller repeat protein [Anaerolineae bacterium]HQH36944.1 PQQ-binding-like beta-propeller repeat protein [Anaerolineae bacterium]